MMRIAQMVDVLLCNHLYKGESADASRIGLVEFGFKERKVSRNFEVLSDLSGRFLETYWINC